MIKNNIRKKEYIFYSLILLGFILLTTIVSLKHEYWADEANAWLIASDLSIPQVFGYMHADSHPALFHMIIKLFISFRLDYNNFHLISIIFSTLGVAYFLFKSNYKWYIKLLLPFTYFIFYQYTVVTRGYCLLLLLLLLIADIWNKRKEKNILFTILLILLLSTEAYTFLLAGSMYLIYIIDYIKEYKTNKKHNKKWLICLGIIFIAFLLTTIYVMPRSTNSFSPRYTTYYISDSFITTFNTLLWIKHIIFVLLLMVFVSLLFKDKSKIWETIVMFTPMFCFMYFRYCNRWHTGIMFLFFIFIGWIHNYSKYKVFNIFMLLTCFIQIYWSFNSSLYDYKESYSPAREVANFIKQYDYENMKIYGLDFYDCSVSPYFDELIYDNWYDIGRLFYWKKDNIFYTKQYNIDTFLEDEVDMVVVTPLYMEFDKESMKEYYDEYVFEGASYFQVDKYEILDIYVYVRK